MSDKKSLVDYVERLDSSNKEYIERIEKEDILPRDKADDTRVMRTEFKIMDNWPAIFYGDQDELYAKLTLAFLTDPVLSENWHRCKHPFIQNLNHNEIQAFSYNEGTVIVKIYKRRHGLFRDVTVDGLTPAVCATFHPVQLEKKMEENIAQFRAMAIAIVNFGKYITQSDIITAFPEPGVFYVPEAV